SSDMVGERQFGCGVVEGTSSFHRSRRTERGSVFSLQFARGVVQPQSERHVQLLPQRPRALAKERVDFRPHVRVDYITRGWPRRRHEEIGPLIQETIGGREE